MLQSKFNGTGYLQVDHRDSPGLTDEQIVKMGAPIAMGMGRKNFQADVVKCWHCQTMIILNPMRKRKHDMCGGCGRCLCPKCYLAYKVSGVCKPFLKVIEEIQENAARALLIKEI